MRHGRLIGVLTLAAAPLPGLLALLALAALLAPRPALAQDGNNVNVRSMVLAETRIAPGAQQLFQVTLSNTNKAAMVAGLHVDLRDDHDRRIGSPMKRSVTLPARDEQRFLFKFHAPQGVGDYAVRFEVMTGDFKQPLIPGNPVYFSPFTVGAGRAVERPVAATAQQAHITAPSFIPPSGLNFERPDLLWENVTLSPRSLLVGEKLHIKADLRNVGGDLARNFQVKVVYFNTRTPNRTEPVSESGVQAVAPGDKLEMEFETVLPDDALLGEYRVTLSADSTDTIDELDESNNSVTTAPFSLTRIKQIFPEPDYAFEEQGLFLFRWDSLRFDEFKVQVGTDSTFTNEANFFDLPQGEKWTKEKEIVPLEGELPSMAQGLMDKAHVNKLYWRVEGRDSKSGRTAFSSVSSFTITPEPKPRETPPPATPQGSSNGAPASTPAEAPAQPAAPTGDQPASGTSQG